MQWSTKYGPLSRLYVRLVYSCGLIPARGHVIALFPNVELPRRLASCDTRLHLVIAFPLAYEPRKKVQDTTVNYNMI